MAPLLEVHLPGCVFALGQLTGRLQTKKKEKERSISSLGEMAGSCLLLLFDGAAA